jgi:hypothetical protein
MSSNFETIASADLATVEGGSLESAFNRGVYEGRVGHMIGTIRGHMTGAQIGAYGGDRLAQAGATVGATVGGIVGAVGGFVYGVGKDINDSFAGRQ